MLTLERTVRLRPIVAGLAALGLAGVAAPAVATDVQHEYFEQYETAFMDACTAWSTQRTCSCAMAALQDQIGFEQFALATVRTQGDVFNDWRWDRTAFRAVETCSAMARPADE